MSRIAYVRVSSIDQNTDRQEIALKKIKIDHYFVEKVSGKNTNRPELKKMLDFIRKGDTIYIESISRLARSTRDLLSIIQQLQDKSVDIVSLKEKIDTSTPQGRFVLTIFGALSELERENTLQRQKEGIAAARIKGKRFGRPRIEKPQNWDKVIALWKKGQITAIEAKNRLNLNHGTFYRMAKKNIKIEFPKPDKETIRKIIKLRLNGLSNKEIAHKLNIKLETVRKYKNTTLAQLNNGQQDMIEMIKKIKHPK